jgi:hypothetical protein
MWWVLLKESKMGKEEGEAERRVKGKEWKEAKRLWIKCLGGGTPVAAAEVFLWYKTGSETGDKRQQNGGDWFGMKEEGKQQQQETACVSCPLNRKASWCQTVAKSNPAVDSCDLPPSHAATNRKPPCFFPLLSSLLARRVGPTRASHHQAVLVARRFALFCIARHSI